MNFFPINLLGAYIVELTPYQDERGWFARTYCERAFQQIDHNKAWVQLNHSFTVKKGTIRGMHYQLPPYKEIKLIRCIAGAVFDVIIDVRKDSPTFLQWFGTTLSAENKKMLYVPEGFAHGFETLEDNCELIYHHSEFYTPGVEAGIRYNDPRINIQWPLAVTMVSPKDAVHEYLDENFKGI